MRALEVSRRALLLCGAALALPACAAQPQALTTPPPLVADDGVFLGPFSNWLDVKARFGAKGDGVTDDTAALQKAMDALDGPDGAHTLWFPPGTYRITRTLTLARTTQRRCTGLSLQGAAPDKVILRWAGAGDGVMLSCDAWYSRIGRITFDGAGLAHTGLSHGPYFATANELADLVFRDLAIGIQAGGAKANGLVETGGIAETSVQRCRFERCTVAGALLGNFNSLDWWFWQCRFEDCGTGVSNTPGAGNFHVYESLFQRSTRADITIRNTGFLSFRDNVSLGSRAFFTAEMVDAGAQLSFQRNRIIDPIETAAIRIGNLGPVLMFDNRFVSRPGASGAVVTGRQARAICVGNSFTVAKAIDLWSGAVEIDSRVAARTVADDRPPALPGAPPLMTLPVATAVPGADAATLQALIDKAPSPSVLHLPAGDYPIDRTLVLPAGRVLYLVGDGIPNRTRLNWKGEGVGALIVARSPSRARIVELSLNATALADGVRVEANGQAGSRLWLAQTLISNAEVAFALDQDEVTQVVMRDINHADSRIGVGVRHPNGRGGGVILSGSSSNNQLSYQIEDGAQFLARDIWYETNTLPRFMRLTGSGGFTLWGSIIATPHDPAAPSVDLDGFRGQVTFLGAQFTAGAGEAAALGPPLVRAKSAIPGARLALLGCHGSGEYLAPAEGQAQVVRSNSVQFTSGGGAKGIADVGRLEPTILREATALARTPLPISHPTALSPGQGDLRLHRVFIGPARHGVWLAGGRNPS